MAFLCSSQFSMSLAVLCIVLVIPHLAFGLVSLSKTFTLRNNGAFQKFTAEYNSNFRVLPFSSFPFLLCFYNTTPNAFTLAVGMGDRTSQSSVKWVWDANRGRPVKENAILSLRADGNLILTDSDGSVAWQTNTPNNGVAGLTLLSNGNLVLTDAKGNIIWQSFHFPGDTIVPGQYLFYNGPNKLTSRVSDKDGSPGPCTYQLEKTHWSLYYTTAGTSLRYYRFEKFYQVKSFQNVTLTVEFVNDDNYEMKLLAQVKNDFPENLFGFVVATKYNSTYSILRMGSDGNLQIYTFMAGGKPSWETTLMYFNREDFFGNNECKLPLKCGRLGVCEDNQCVGCPQPQGFIGWSPACAPPSQQSCSGGGIGAVGYYAAAGVDQFLIQLEMA